MTSLAYAALWVFVFSVPWERIIVLPGVSIVSRAAGGLALGLTLLSVVISGRIRRWHAFHAAALVFVLWAGCVLLVIDIPEVPDKFWTFVQLFLVVWMIWELAPSRRRLVGLLAGYVLGAYVAAFDTILLYRRQAAALRRFAAGGADPNDLAMTLALALAMAWYLGMTYRRPLLRWICRSYLAIGLVAIGLTGSRGGMVATMVALLIVPLTLTKLSPGRLATAIVMLVLSGALAVAYVPQSLVERFASTRTELQEGDLNGRLEIWKAGMAAFTAKPLMGYGTAGFKEAVTPWVGRRVAHNSFLSVLVEQGIVGFLLYMTMFGAVFLPLLNLPPMERRFALVLFATVVVAMLPLTWEDHKIVWFTLATLLGLSAAQGEAVRQPLPHPVAAARPLVAPLSRARSTFRSPDPPIRTPHRNA